MKKLWSFVLLLCLFLGNIQLLTAKQIDSPKQGGNNYHAIDYVVQKPNNSRQLYRSCLLYTSVSFIPSVKMRRMKTVSVETYW